MKDVSCLPYAYNPQFITGRWLTTMRHKIKFAIHISIKFMHYLGWRE